MSSTGTTSPIFYSLVDWDWLLTSHHPKLMVVNLFLWANLSRSMSTYILDKKWSSHTDLTHVDDWKPSISQVTLRTLTHISFY